MSSSYSSILPLALSLVLTLLFHQNPLVIKYVMDEAALTTEENCLMFSEPNKSKEVQKQLYTPIIKAAQNAMACQFSEGIYDNGRLVLVLLQDSGVR